MGTIGDGDTLSGGGPAADAAMDPGRASQPAAKCGGAIGDVAMHRLSSIEYNNTVLDLLGDSSQPANAFPPDDTANSSFTNNADSLSISPVLFEAYEAAAESLSQRALSGPARARILSCDPTKTGEEACARTLLSAFATRAWRRPVTPDEVTTLVGVAGIAKTQGDPFETGIQLAIKTTLLSPNFLYRPEIDPDLSAVTPHLLLDHEVASRLSYFLWSTMPDDALIAAADRKELRTVDQIDQQARRMLADPRARSLLDNFAMQWLNRTFRYAKPDAAVFPDFDDSLRSAMETETRTFLNDFVFGTAGLDQLLDA